MDPFDILGINPTRNIVHIKAAYKKMLIATHPDKMNGDAKYFMMVHQAYKGLSDLYGVKERNAPQQKPKYEQQICNEQKQRKMSNAKFNEFYSENKIEGINPFQKGYGKDMCERLNYQEDDKQLMKQKKPSRKNREVVIYKEPKSASNTTWVDSCEPLAKTTIKDFSTKNGCDYRRAYDEPEEMVDTVTRFKNVEELKNNRIKANFKQTREEKRYYAEQNECKQKMNLMHQQNRQKNRERIQEQYNILNNRLKY